MSEALNPTFAGGHACKPTALAGYRAHACSLEARFRCACGAVWRATHGDTVVEGRDVCGCGWARVDS